MALIPQAEVSDLFPTVQQEVARLAAAPEVRSAYNWFRSQEPQLAHWQVEVARIPAPPFGESARAAWLAERFRDLALDDVRTDDVGNVFGVSPGYGKRYVALSAHIDTVFPAPTQYQATGKPALWAGSVRQWRWPDCPAGDGRRVASSEAATCDAVCFYWKCGGGR